MGLGKNENNNETEFVVSFRTDQKGRNDRANSVPLSFSLSFSFSFSFLLIVFSWAEKN